MGRRQASLGTPVPRTPTPASSEPVIDTPENPNDISISDVARQSSDEHEPSDNVNDNIHVDAQPSNNNDVEIEPIVDVDNPQSKNQLYDKRLCC